jgi:hypothetical protein
LRTPRIVGDGLTSHIRCIKIKEHTFTPKVGQDSPRTVQDSWGYLTCLTFAMFIQGTLYTSKVGQDS